MNVEIRAEAALFPEKEYISGIFVAVYDLAPPPPPSPLPFTKLSLFLSSPSCVSPVGHTDGRGVEGRGGGGRRDSLVLYISFNTLCCTQTRNQNFLRCKRFNSGCYIYEINFLASFQTKENPFFHLRRCT
jgi:hypothetical protein